MKGRLLQYVLCGVAAVALVFMLRQATAQGEKQSTGPTETDNRRAEITTQSVTATQTNVMKTFSKPSETELKKKLDRTQFNVTQQCGTEPPFLNAYWNNHRPGIYVDVVSGEPLFSSLDKFDSGTGWPSFTQPIVESEIVEKSDVSHGMERVEVRSKTADSHLGHLFPDGPAPTGMRYCINSASLRFVPMEKMEEEGFGAYLEPFIKAGLYKKK